LEPEAERIDLLGLGRSVRESFQLVRGTFSSLQHRQFALFFWTQLVSASGEWVQIATINIVVLRLAGGGRQLALANISAFVPFILLTPVAGAWADAYGKIRLLAFSNSGLVVVTAGLGILAQTHLLSLQLIYIGAAVSGSLSAFDVTVRQALVGDLVPLGDLANGVGLNVTSLTTARAVGPFTAAILIPLLGIQGCFYVNAASYGVLLVALPRLRAARNDIAQKFLPRTSLLAGIRTVWRDRSLRVPISQIAVLSGFGVTSTILLPLLVVRTLHSPGGTYALLAGLVGTGTVIGGLSTAARRILGSRPVAVCALFLSATLAIVGASSSVIVAGPPLFLSGVFAACAIATALASAQVAAAPEMRGRVIAIYTVVFSASSGLVSPATGLIADATSPRTGYYICAAVVAASAALALSYRPGRVGAHIAQEPATGRGWVVFAVGRHRVGRNGASRHGAGRHRRGAASNGFSTSRTSLSK
jgi:MFS family permease